MRQNSLFLAISCFLNYKEWIQKFCTNYVPPLNLKKLTSDNKLKPRHWQELLYLYNDLKTFYKATLMVESNNTGLTNYFQTLNWLLLKLKKLKIKFLQL